MRFDRDVYFTIVREALFEGAMTQQQVDGQSVILACFEYDAGGTPMSDVRWLAYMLATTYKETDRKMWPIEEYGRGEGKPYGELDDQTFQTYYGRGYVQLTWKENYGRASSALGLIDDRDLVWNPHMALDSLVAARIMFRGMAEGWFTGAKLGQFFNDEDDNPIDARTIINGHDCDEEIADYHGEFLRALEDSREKDYL